MEDVVASILGMSPGLCSLSVLSSAVVTIPLMVLSLCHVCSVTSLSLMVTACTSPSSGKNDSAAILSSLPLIGSASEVFSGFTWPANEIGRDLLAPGFSDFDIVAEFDS